MADDKFPRKRRALRRGSARGAGRPALSPMSPMELAQLGEGSVAYIKVLSGLEAKRIYPDIEQLPDGVALFALHGADGTPIALTDSRHAAIGHAMEVELEVTSVH